MRTRVLIPAVALGLLLSGCALTPPGPPPGQRSGPPAGCPGSGAECNVYVDVTSCTQVAFDPDPLEVKGGARVIHWRIGVGEGSYTFAPAGIIIKDPDPDHQFQNGRRVEQGKGYQLTDRNKDTKTYRYGVDLMHGTEACPRFDPTIINRG
jgi:hypothetical protein